MTGPNHAPHCSGTNWKHSGTGYSRIRLCACGAEDHDPEPTMTTDKTDPLASFLLVADLCRSPLEDYENVMVRCDDARAAAAEIRRLREELATAKQDRDNHREALQGHMRAERDGDRASQHALAVKVATEARDIAVNVRDRADEGYRTEQHSEAWFAAQRIVMHLNLLLNRTIDDSRTLAAAKQPEPAPAEAVTMRPIGSAPLCSDCGKAAVYGTWRWTCQPCNEQPEPAPDRITGPLIQVKGVTNQPATGGDGEALRLRNDPIIYHLDDGQFTRGVLTRLDDDGTGHLIVDLTSFAGPSVVGKPDWFDAGYVALYGGLVPETAQRGSEPGQWDYGAMSIDAPQVEKCRRCGAASAAEAETMCRPNQDNACEGDDLWQPSQPSAAVDHAAYPVPAHRCHVVAAHPDGDGYGPCYAMLPCGRHSQEQPSAAPSGEAGEDDAGDKDMLNHFAEHGNNGFDMDLADPGTAHAIRYLTLVVAELARAEIRRRAVAAKEKR